MSASVLGIGVAVMWRTCGLLLRQSCALLDAEPVLLVNDRDGEVGELDLSLDQGMRPDRDAHVARRDELVGRATLASGEARREQRHADAELRAQPFDREEVLLGERLRRRHQCALPPSLGRAEERVQRDRGLAGADVPLEQPLHRDRPGEIRVDLGNRLVLRPGEREREEIAVAGDELGRRRQGLRYEHLSLGGAPPQRQLEGEQLVEREAPAGSLGLVLRAGAMEPDQRVSPQRQALARPDVRGQRLASVPREAEGCLRHRPQCLLREVGGRRVDRREVGGLSRVPDVVGGDLEPEAVLLAA